MQKFPCNLTRNIAYIQYRELGFSQFTQMKDDYTTNSHYCTLLTRFLFRGWENVLFELGSNRVNMRGMYKADELWYEGARMNHSIHSMSSSGFHSTKPSPGANYSITDSHNSIYAVDQGGNNQIWTIGNIINKNRTILYLIRPAEAVMEREQPRSTWNKDKIGGQHCWQKRISKQLCLTMHAQIFENPQNFAPMKHTQISKALW